MWGGGCESLFVRKSLPRSPSEAEVSQVILTPKKKKKDFLKSNFYL